MALDGTEVRLPKNEGSATCIRHRSGSSADYNAFHLSLAADRMSHTFLEAEIEAGSKAKEIKTARRIIWQMDLSEGKTLFVADRYYNSLDFIESICLQGADYLVRFRNAILSDSREAPMEEWDMDFSFSLYTIETKKAAEEIRAGRGKYEAGSSPYGKESEEVRWAHGDGYLLSYRAVRVMLDTEEYETLITSFPRDIFSPEKLKGIYHMRWSIETVFRFLKYSSGLRHLHSRDEELVKQEIWSRLLVHNLAARIANAAERDDPPEDGRRRVNLSQVAGIVKEALRGRWDVDLSRRAAIARWPKGLAGATKGR